MDRFSPVAPAHIRVLVLPVGEIKRLRYLSFLARLQKEAWIVNLADIERYVKDDDLLLSPKAFPKGSILFNYSTSLPNPQQEQLSPFELFREPLLVLGVVDEQGGQDGADEEELEPASIYLRERHPRVVHRQLLILEDVDSLSGLARDNAIRIPNAATPGDEALKDAVCQISARFLKELSTYTQAMQASPSVQTPGQTARSLQRTTSQREHDKRPSSGHSTPTKNAEPTTPVDNGGGVKLPPSDRGSPATSFDQIASANNASGEFSRSDSRASNKSKHHRRASSQDRVPLQGFGSGTSQDKLKQRGKARVGIVIGSLYMTAGQWSEGLRILVEHTNKARILSDHIWHAKGLENIIVCLLLHSWAGLEFQIPSICYTLSDRSSTQQRFSVNLPPDFKPADAAQVASVRRLSTSLPDLLKLVLSLYRSIEGSLELPFISISEATVRFSKLLAVLHLAGGELDHSTLDHFIGSSTKDGGTSSKTSSLPRAGGPSKMTISEMLSHAHTSNEDTLKASDQIPILAGTASVYALLQMHRKKANVLRALVVKLTIALTQARKRGAAEAGIHPAASLSGETAVDTILALTQDSKGVHKMMAEIARIYGVQLPEKPGDTEDQPRFQPGFGSDSLKVSILRDLNAFCEATPDPYGVLQMTTAVLEVFGPNGAVDVEAYRCNGVLTKDDQVRLAATLARTIGVSKHLGIPDVEAEYWDPYLVRAVEFVPPGPGLEIIDRGNKQSKPGAADNETTAADGNPLLYDPNAKRPGAASKLQDAPILVANEASTCLITLQNPYEFPIEVESLALGTDGMELRIGHGPITLHPMRLQQVPIVVLPATPGHYKIDHIRAKLSGCTEMKFPIVSKAWTPEASTLVKDLGQDARTPEAPINAQGSSVENTVVEVRVIEPQPLLILENRHLQDASVMLLDGEERKVSVVVRNVSSIPLTIINRMVRATYRPLPDSDLDTPLTHEFQEQPKPRDVDAGGTFEFELTMPRRAKPNVSRMRYSFIYCCQQEGHQQYGRRLNLTLHLTLNAALQAQHLRATPLHDPNKGADAFMLSFDLRNAWPKPLDYVASMKPQTDGDGGGLPVTKASRELNPGQVERVDILMPRIVLSSAAGLIPKELTKALLKTLSVTWRGEDRAGEVDLSGFVLSSEDVEIATKSAIHLDLHLIYPYRPQEEDSASEEPVVKVGSYVTLKVTISTPPGVNEPLLVRMRPRAVNSTNGDRTTGAGITQHGFLDRTVRRDGAGGETTHHFPTFPALVGRVELEVTARSALGSDSRAELGVARRKISMMAVQ